jgi:C-terminal processing protease CtpA/Prc
MTTRSICILVLFAGLGLGAVLGLRPAPAEDCPETEAVIAQLPAPPEPVREPEPPPDPPALVVVEHKEPEEPVERVVMAQPPAPKPKPVAAAPTRISRKEQRKRAMERYYGQMERNFGRQMNQLDQAETPEQRQQLIHALAKYVRVDTVAALDWAATLSDPEEKRVALEAINKNALTGIGARIETDETGLPKIKQTTILSAVESTGRVEPGDYISGMVKPDGTLVYFKGWPTQKIAENLRGIPGSEIQLMMERVTPDGVWHSFDVPVQRSLIVMEPMY